MGKYTTNSAKETQKLGKDFANEILSSAAKKTARVLCLEGDLGAGKTTFLQGFAKGLGISENINSPTFVIMKRFALADKSFNNFYHIDCYRLNNKEEIMELSFGEIILNPKNIVAIEWPEKIASILPKSSILIIFEHLEKSKREILINP